MIIALRGTNSDNYVPIPSIVHNRNARITFLAFAIDSGPVTAGLQEQYLTIALPGHAIVNSVQLQNDKMCSFLGKMRNAKLYEPMSESHAVDIHSMPKEFHIQLGPEGVVSSWTNATTWMLFLELQ